MQIMNASDNEDDENVPALDEDDIAFIEQGHHNQIL